MRTASFGVAEAFNAVVDRMIAALHQQREIEARRALWRYRHLLEMQQETLLLNQVDFVDSEEGFSDDANQSDARERATRNSSFARA